MPDTDALKTIVAKQKDLLDELESEAAALAEHDLKKENDALKAALETLQAQYAVAETNLKELADQNAQLKNSLYEHIYSEKLAIMNITEARLNIFFRSNIEGEINRLTAFEREVRNRIGNMANLLTRHNVDTADEIYKRLDELSYLLDQKVSEARAQLAQAGGVFSENEKAEFEALKNEQITEREIIDSAKKNNFEAFIGLNLINKIGILLIIIGVIAASQFAFTRMPDSVKSIMMFSLGGVMLLAGEFINRKKANVFSLGITAGGVGVLYVATVTSAVVLKLNLFTATMYPALAAIIGITAVAFFLSLRYNSQTVAVFALIGGYLPIFRVSGSLTLMYYAILYFVILNLFALLIAMNKKWTVTSFFGLFLNMAATLYIIVSINAELFPWDAPAVAFGLPHIATLGYLFFAFVIYTLIPVFGTYFKKLSFKTHDVVLLAINIVYTSVFMVSLFYRYDLEKYLGLLALGFAAVYLLIGLFIHKKFEKEKAARALFYLTGFVFVVLFVPFQLDRIWFSLGWLLEGVVLTTYGILMNKKVFRTCGFVINALCVGSFLLFDVLMGYADEWARTLGYDLFTYKYSLITLGSFIILGAFIYKKMLSGTFQKVYKYIATANLWFFAIYLSYKILNDVLYARLEDLSFSSFYLASALAIALTFIIAHIAPRIRLLADNGMTAISMAMHAIGIIWLFILNSSIFVYESYRYSWDSYEKVIAPQSTRVIGTLILIAICLMSIAALMDFTKTLVMKRHLAVEWFPIVVSTYAVLALTQNLIINYDVAFTNIAFSIIYVLTALAWIVFGFVKRYKVIRLFGLGLALFSVAKLFVIDLNALTQGYRIISFFALGISLIAISFIYQYFNKRLEMKESTVKK